MSSFLQLFYTCQVWSADGLKPVLENLYCQLKLRLKDCSLL